MEIQEIKTQLRMLAVLHYYGLKPDKNAKLKYPFHDGKTPSLQVYYKMQKAYCFSGNCKTNGNMLLTVNYYDVRARLVGVKQQNHLGGTDIITNEYSFVGELTSSKREHKAGVGGTTTILTKNTYDHVGRLLSASHQADSQAEVMLAQHVYNEIGQLKEKQIGLDAAGTNPTTTISYAYNSRGWLESASSSIFSQQLFYHTSTGGVAPQYNGNIASQQWMHRDETTKQFTYTYDKLNRLKLGNSDAGMREELSYDDMGNITNLKRDGHATGIQYQYGGNQLLSVSNQV